MPAARGRRLAGLAILAAWLAPSRFLGSGPVLCPVRRFTGLPCPTCGLTRSWNAALHGRPGASLGHHPLGPATLGAAAAYALGLDERAPSVVRPLRRPGVAGVLAAAWLLAWAMRLRAAGRPRAAGRLQVARGLLAAGGTRLSGPGPARSYPRACTGGAPPAR